MALTHTVLAPLTAEIGRAHGRFGAVRVTAAQPVHPPQIVGRSHRYPPVVASRVIGTAGNAALSTTASVVDPYVTYASAYTGRFAGRHYAQRRMGTVQWRGGWRGPRFGQNPFSDLYNAAVNAAENVAGGLPINAPNAGGGSVTTSGGSYTDPYTGQLVTVPTGTQYVNASGEDQSTPDPTAGQTPGQQLQQAAFDATPWLVGGGLLIGGFILYKVLK